MNKNKNLNKTLLIKSFHVTSSPESKTQAFIKFWYLKNYYCQKNSITTAELKNSYSFENFQINVIWLLEKLWVASDHEIL